MIADIKKKQNGLLTAKLKSEELALNLEKRVLERTKELSEVNEATLNILEDLTLAKESLAEHAKKLEKALTARSDFISTVSHELRTPLTAMKEGIAIVLDGSAGPVNHDQKEFLDLAKRNVDRLARLINQVLDFQKLESGLMVFDIKEEDINTAIKDVCQTMSVSAKQKGLELVCQLQEGLVSIYFDRDKIIQVISNLVNNAIKFTDKGTITLNTAKGNNFVQVSVRDTGVGVKKEDLSKLFQKFSQLGNVNERKTGGSGLGLAISKEIIEKHHGKIWAESRPGEGTVFHFLLPIKERRV